MEQQEEQAWLLQLIFAGTLGMPLLTALILWLERLNRHILKSPLIFTGLVLTALYAVYFPSELNPLNLFVHLLLCAAAFLLISVAPFRQNSNSFHVWSFNKQAVQGLLLAFGYSAFLFLSLALLLFSTATLFKPSFDEEQYFQLFIVISYFLAPLLFLGFLPREAGIVPCPKVLHYFCHYLLAQVASLYMLVLCVYILKIISQWEWPNGMVALPVLGLAGLSLGLYLLSWPQELHQQTFFARLLRKLLFPLLLPPVVLMGGGTFRRIYDYGFTEARVLLVLITFWLAGVCLFFLFRKPLRTFFIPLSLGLLLFVAACTAWPLARWNQAQRFRQITATYIADLPHSGKEEALPLEARQELTSIAFYFSQRNKLSYLQEKLSLRLPDSLLHNAPAFMQAIGIAYAPPGRVAAELAPFIVAVQGKEGSLLPVANWDFLLEVEASSSQVATSTKEEVRQVRLIGNELQLIIRGDSLLFDMRPLLTKLAASGRQTWPSDSLELQTYSTQWAGLLIVETINGVKEQGIPEVQYLSGKVLLRQRKK